MWETVSRILIIVFTCALCVGHVTATDFHQDIIQNEDDDIINEAMTTRNFRQNKRNGVSFDYPLSFHSIRTRTDTPGSKRTNPSNALNIVKDVNKYGLWEYTADNTGMGEQFKKIMSTVHNKEMLDASDSHSLEKTANKMNAEINKYAEGPDASPTIDPMETPEGYTPTEHSVQYAGPDSSPINHNNGMENVDVVTIPNSMTIEDEHGNNLDSVQVKSFNVDVKPTSKYNKEIDGVKFPSYSKVIHKPTAYSGGEKPKPTTPLLDKLLRALKTNPAFRNTASSLLPAVGDTEIDTLNKQRKLAYFLKTYEEMKDSVSDKLKEKVPRQYNDDGVDKTEKDSKLLSVIKNLIRNDKDDSVQRDQLHDLLSALKANEKGAAKMEQEFYDVMEPKVKAAENTSQSEPYMKHFKDFLSQHRDEKLTSNYIDHPLGTAVGSPLMGYLEQESATVNSLHDAGVDPKLEFSRLEHMLAQQKTEQEEIQKQHDKALIEQFRQLLKQERNNKVEAPETGNEKISADMPHDKTFTDVIFNALKESKDFQEFAENETSNEHLVEEHTHTEGSPKEETPKDAADISSGAGEDKSIQEQLEEIEKQKEELREKEEKLRKLNKERDEYTAKIIQKVKQQQDEEERKNVNHLLHLANPKKHKTVFEQVQEALLGFQKVQHKNIRPKYKKVAPASEKKIENTDKLQNNENDTSVEDTNKNKLKATGNIDVAKKPANIAKNVDPEEKKNQEGNKNQDTMEYKSQSSKQNNTSKSSHNPTDNTNPDNSNTESKKSRKLGEEEQYKIVDMHESTFKGASVPDAKDASLSSKQKSKSDSLAETLHATDKDGTLAEFLKLTKGHNEKLGLPISNPAPTDDNGIEPHENFHHTFHSEKTDDNQDIGIAPIPSPIRMHHHRHHLTSPSIMYDHANNIPPAGMGKPQSEHRIYPIEEPPPLVSFHPDTNHHATKTNSGELTSENAPNTVENLLKHKIPRVEASKGLHQMLFHSPSGSLHLTPYARIIRPKLVHSKMIDITASKKSFGKPPQKPKSYLLKELREKLKLFSEKRSRMKKFLSKHHNASNSSVSKFNSTTLRTILKKLTNKKLTSNQLANNTFQSKSGIVVPSHIKQRVITIDDANFNQTDSNVIIPSSISSKLYSESRNADDVIRTGVNPSDITRSNMPKVINSNGETHKSIEDVFNLLGSEDQLTV